MLNMKIRKPSATASIWSSGKVTVTGPTLRTAAASPLEELPDLCKKLDFLFKIVNVLGTCSLPFGIKLTDFSRENIGKVQYEPELHPGATYRIADISATLKIFSTGSITITAPKVQNIQLAVEHVFPLVYPFRKPKKSDPREIEYIRDLLEDENLRLYLKF
ncbi:Trf2 [Bugula neritina]|uniref:TATA box-binding protein-like 1 n=1 Tax=Bugula neritina TaxID=10212 RepID=A0A7J7JGQ7_BUGNE|nr:Trf2 [Bugula neritina]